MSMAMPVSALLAFAVLTWLSVAAGSRRKA
jgi:hypothetical protein